MVVLQRVATKCQQCRATGFDIELSMAFQPIVDLERRVVVAQEALVRGAGGQGAASVFAHVNDDNRYRFDQQCRIKAVQLAAKVGISSLLHINFMPNAVYEPERCIRTTVEAARTAGLSLDQICLEITESERVADVPRLRAIIDSYRAFGFSTALDDFGAGYAGLNLLAELQTNFLKLDMALIRAIDRDRTRQAIVRGIVQVCEQLSIMPIAEGIETVDEARALLDLGIPRQQGYLYARPAFEAQAEVAFPSHG